MAIPYPGERTHVKITRGLHAGKTGYIASDISAHTGIYEILLDVGKDSLMINKDWVEMD